MTIARVRSAWLGPLIRGGGVTDLYFLGSTGDEDSMVAAVVDFWSDLAGTIGINNGVLVDNAVTNIDQATGDVISIVTTSPPPDIVDGTNSAEAISPLNQGLVQWITGAIVSNRRVRGRTFIGAQTEGSNAAGVVAQGARDAWQAAADGLLAATNAQLQVWHRPKNGSGGSSHDVTAAQTWTEFASLRSRRD